MSLFTTPIPEDIRNAMTVCPPPVYTCDGVLMPYGCEMESRYNDMAIMKSKSLIHICDEVDSEDWNKIKSGKAPLHLIIRCMANDADLRVILNAAVHLGFICDPKVYRRRRDNIDPRYEAEYIEVRYSIPPMSVTLDGDYTSSYPNYIDYRDRVSIWRGLFQAMGYRVKFGDALNIKRSGT